MRDESVGALAGQLAGHAEALCRRYLPGGRREGRYWLVGDVTGAPGRSLFVRLEPSGSKPAGKWSDAATGEYGDLLDLIRLHLGYQTLAEAIAEARSFLSLPMGASSPRAISRRTSSRPDVVSRIWTTATAIPGTLAERYLAHRALSDAVTGDSLRFHPACPFRDGQTLRRYPALIAAVRDGSGMLVGIHRTALDPVTCGKANLTDPRRSLGSIHGHGVRLGHRGADGPLSLVVGEGLETTLSVSLCLPHIPAIATLSAGHLGAVHLPSSLQTLCIAVDNDKAGRQAAARLRERALTQGIGVILLRARLGDFNDDLRADGVTATRSALLEQLAGSPVSVD